MKASVYKAGFICRLLMACDYFKTAPLAWQPPNFPFPLEKKGENFILANF
jgi:hypothetical protein